MRPAPAGIAVYDGAFSPAAGRRLADIDISTLGSYRRSCGATTAAEHFIESLLHELGETCDEVEYWGREAWRPVCAHADIDERCARERGELRFPAAVLVVYVQVELQPPDYLGYRVFDPNASTYPSVPRSSRGCARRPCFGRSCPAVRPCCALCPPCQAGCCASTERCCTRYLSP